MRLPWRVLTRRAGSGEVWRRRLSAAASAGAGTDVSEPWATHAGEGALLLRFGTEIGVGVNQRVLDCLGALDSCVSRPAGIYEMLPGYSSLMVHFDPLQTSHAEVEKWCNGGATAAAVQTPKSEVNHSTTRYAC